MGGCGDPFICCHPKQALHISSHCLLKLAPTNLEWLASFLGLSLPCEYGSWFRIHLGSSYKCYEPTVCHKRSPPGPDMGKKTIKWLPSLIATSKSQTQNERHLSTARISRIWFLGAFVSPRSSQGNKGRSSGCVDWFLSGVQVAVLVLKFA